MMSQKKEKTTKNKKKAMMECKKEKRKHSMISTITNYSPEKISSKL